MVGEREKWIDAYKGGLILLVVLGHVIGGAIHLLSPDSSSRRILEYLFKFIYLFHMPAFFFIAGITWDKGQQLASVDFLIRKAKRILVPYFIFGVLSGVLYLLSAQIFNETIGKVSTDSYYSSKTVVDWWVPFIGILHGGGWPNGLGFIANSVLWFLPCLFIVELVYFSLARIVKPFALQLLIGVLLLIFDYPLRCVLPETLPWGIGKLTYFLPFVILGRWFPKSLKDFGYRIHVIVGCTLLIGLCFFTVYSPNAYHANVSWDWALVFSVSAVMGIIALFFLIQFLNWHWIRICGIASLEIMLFHKFFIIALQLKVSWLRSMINVCGGGLIVAVILISIVSVLGSLAIGHLINRYCPWLMGKKNLVFNNNRG